MLSLRNFGAAAAIAAMTLIGGVTASNAAVFQYLPGNPNIISPNLDDTLFFRNATPDLITGQLNAADIHSQGTLVAGRSFNATTSDTSDAGNTAGNFFEFTAAAQPGFGDLRVQYFFDVTVATAPGGNNQIGVGNLTFDVFRNGGLVNTFQLTDGAGVVTGTTQFNVTWNDGDLIRWEVSGNTLNNGGGYEILVQAVPIPLPAPVLMLLGGLAGLVFLGRRRSSTAAAA